MATKSPPFVFVTKLKYVLLGSNNHHCSQDYLRAALNTIWMDKVPNMELYGDIPKIMFKTRDCRLSAASYFYHNAEVASRFLLCVPKHGSLGAQNKDLTRARVDLSLERVISRERLNLAHF